MADSPFKNIWSALGDREFYWRDFRNAYHYNPSQDPPRQQFGGYVSFVLDRDLFGQPFFDEVNNDELRVRMSSLVRTADMPQVDFQTQTMNEYNKKKIINTGVEYQPVTIRVVDTASNAWLQIIMKYFAYHYMNPRNKGQQGDRDINSTNIGWGGADFIGAQYGAGGTYDSNRYGYNPNANPNFFERIDYVLYHGQKGVQYSLLNPVMTGFTHTPIDYASNDVAEFTMTFQYEGFTTYDQTNFDLTTVDLARFEDVSGLSGSAMNQNFQNDGSGSIAASTERDLAFLGNTNNKLNRTYQPVIFNSPNDFPTDKNGLGGDITTYGTETPQSGGTNFVKNLFGEFLGDVADKALSAAINGADVKDAALGAVFDGVAGIITENNRPDRRPPIVEDETSETENGNTTPSG
jgi:hypothetical protein